MREGEAGQPVRYSGKTDGQELTLEIVFEKGDRGGPYALGLGRQYQPMGSSERLIYTCFTLRYSSTPHLPSSRPMPLCL